MEECRRPFQQALTLPPPSPQVYASIESATTWVGESLPLDPLLPRSQLRASASLRRHEEHAAGEARLFASQLLSTALAGVLVGLTAVALQGSVDRLVALRNAALQQLLQSWPALAAAAAALGGVSLVVAAAAAVQFLAPRAGGGGVTLLMAHLNGLDVPNLFCLRVYVVKLLGCIAVRCANMVSMKSLYEQLSVHSAALERLCPPSSFSSQVYGVEAPLVLLGAISSTLEFELRMFVGRRSRGLNWPWAKSDGGEYEELAGAASGASMASSKAAAAEDEAQKLVRASADAAEQQELIAAGAAAGLAAAFFRWGGVGRAHAAAVAGLGSGMARHSHTH